MSQLGFYYDMTACSGCKTCQIACKDKNNLEIGNNFRKVHSFEGGEYPGPWFYPLSIACNHCRNPKCVANCPSGALSKRGGDGIVVHDKGKCIGCRLCLWSCPYDAPQYNKKTGKVGKCDFCLDLLEQGESPACVSACLMRCLEYGDIDELNKRHGGTPDVKGLPDSRTTQPALAIQPHPRAKR